MALLQIGVGAVGTTANPQDIASGVMHLNMILAKWQQQKFIVPNLVDLPVTSTGASIYYLGPGGDFSVANRPGRIEAAYARLTTSGGFQPSEVGDFSDADFGDEFGQQKDGLEGRSNAGPLDFPLAIITSYEEYAAIRLKGLRTWPSAVYYSPSYPLGELRFFPIPQASMWELHILVREQLPAGLGPDSEINLPHEYWDLIMWSLAARLAPSYGQEASPTVIAMAKAAFSQLRAENQQIPRVQMPSSIGSRAAASTNPWWIYTGGIS